MTTLPPPPERMVSHFITYLERRIAKGDYPPAGWLEWLQATDKALRECETEQLEILAAADLDKFADLKF